MTKFARCNWGRIFAAALAGASMLAGCQTTPMAKVTGTHGGMLPGMAPPGAALTPAQAAKLNAPQSIAQATQVRLPDGGVRIDQTLGGVLYSQAWYSSAGAPLRSVIYADGRVPMRLYEYTSDGRMQRATTLYPNTSQAQRVEEYNEMGDTTKFTEYWPNGSKRVVSEANVETPAGPVWRVQEWYDNGLPKSLTQRDTDGKLEGRQTRWDTAGAVVSDIGYHAGVMQQDYMLK